MEVVISRNKWGHAICSHNIDKRYCKECGGSAFCIHDKLKSRCRECGGSAFCIHNKEKSQCMECGGNSLCYHNIQKSQCRECGGSIFCSHNIHKTRCRECGGSAFCIHDKLKARCKECEGSTVCTHGKRKEYCKECDGSAYCSHNIRKDRCKICSPNSNAFCKSCRLFQVNKSTNYLCNYCNPTTKLREKTKEIKLKNFLEEHYKVCHNVSVKIENSCYNNFPDFMIYLQDKIIIIECDENAHRSYPIDCEIIRMNNIQFSLKSNVIWIRFNPDKVKVLIKTKYTVLKSYIDYYMNSNILNGIVYLFY